MSDEPWNHNISRRRILKLGGTLLAAAVSGAWLEACGSSSQSTPTSNVGGQSPAPSPTPTAAPTSMSSPTPMASPVATATTGNTSSLPFGLIPVQGNVSITVTDGPGPGWLKQDRDFYMDLIKKYNAIFPNVKITPHAGGYDPQAFAAKIAGNKVEDGFAVWFTEPQKFIEQGVAADITDYIKQWKYFNEFRPEALTVLKDKQGHIYGVPVSMYALSLAYNRKIFEKAGLDPDKPPTTWDELRQYAKQIVEKTGLPGFCFLSTNNQGGWYFTTLMYTMGATPEQQINGKWTATFNDKGKGLEILKLLHDMKWVDKSMTPQALRDQGKQSQLLATGRVAMAISGIPGADELAKYKADIKDFGLGIVPQGGGNAVLGGGYAWMFNKKSSPEQIKAAIDWVLFTNFYPENVEAGYKKDRALNRSIGFPSPPIFEGELQKQLEALIEKYATVPNENYTPYTEGMKRIAVKSEPPIETQKMYATLDPVVQAALTKENVDMEALLMKAQKDFQTSVLDKLS